MGSDLGLSGQIVEVSMGRAGGRMRLQELLSFRHTWTDYETIYVVRPWGCDAEAMTVSPAPDTTEPVVRSGQRYDYFIEGSIARDCLDDLGASEGPVSKEVCERLIRYAIYDA
jgi:hypothetical protein